MHVAPPSMCSTHTGSPTAAPPAIDPPAIDTLCMLCRLDLSVVPPTDPFFEPFFVGEPVPIDCPVSKVMVDGPPRAIDCDCPNPTVCDWPLDSEVEPPNLDTLGCSTSRTLMTHVGSHAATPRLG